MAVVTPVALRDVILLFNVVHKYSLYVFKWLVHDPQNMRAARNIENRFLCHFSHDEANIDIPSLTSRRDVQYTML
jgi:hypothetical protein